MFPRLLLSPLVAAALLSGCDEPYSTPAPQVGLANPASQHCIRKGGTLIERRTAEGTLHDCRLPDGRTVEEWALFRSAHGF